MLLVTHASNPLPGTTTQAGIFQNINAAKASSANAKSKGLSMALVQTGSYNAASRRPTTPALTPASAAWVRALERRRCQKGHTPITSRNEGAKIAMRQTAAPAQPDGWTFMDAPRNAANVKSGPGTACAKPYPARNVSLATQPFGTVED